MTLYDPALDIPDPEVVPKARRRQFSAGYKKRILEETDRCTEAGQIGALLRREGLYSSHLSTWRSALPAPSQTPAAARNLRAIGV